EGLKVLVANQREHVQDVRGALDAFEALEMLEHEPADLIITDINMPEMSGLELIREVKARNYCDRTAILTGYDDFQYAKQAIKYQVLDYLMKSINKEEPGQLLALTHEDVKQGGSLKQQGAAAPPLKDHMPQHEQLLAYIH